LQAVDGQTSREQVTEYDHDEMGRWWHTHQAALDMITTPDGLRFDGSRNADAALGVALLSARFRPALAPQCVQQTQPLGLLALPLPTAKRPVPGESRAIAVCLR
jgi:hypothetical protein